MEMKIKYVFMAVLAVAVSACEPSHLEDNLYDSVVYITNNGYNVSEVFYDVEGMSVFPIYAYCGGFYGGNPQVRLTADKKILDNYNESGSTTLSMLPEDCYHVENIIQTMENNRATFNLVFDCDKLKALSGTQDYSDLKNYAVAFKLISLSSDISDASDREIGTIIVVPNMSQMAFTFENAGAEDCDWSAMRVDEEYLYMDYTLVTPVENHWDNEVVFKFNEDGGRGKYDLLPEDSYTVSSTAEKFMDGVSEITYTVKIEKEKVKDIMHYSLVASVESAGDFLVSGSNYSVRNMLNAYYYPQNKISVKSCNSYVTGRGADKALDGNLSTQWESAYNGSAADHIGVFDLPYEIVFELSEEIPVYGVEIYRRQGTYASDLKSDRYEISKNGTDFKAVYENDYGDTSNKASGPFYYTWESKVENVKYVKFVATGSNRFYQNTVPLAHLAEFNVIYR